jgi:H+-translocating NAD(P) transhydrogenase
MKTLPPSPSVFSFAALSLFFTICSTDYESSGAKVVDKTAAFQSDIVLKVRAPTPQETGLFRDEGTLYSFLYPAQNKELVEALAKHKLTVFGMDCVPRISRAQVSML